MLVNTICKFLVQSKQIVFKISLKNLNINFFPLSSPKFLPSQKQIFQANNF